MKKILISTGGSGGHVIPALSFYQHLKNKFKVSIVTDQRGIKYIDNKNFKTIQFKILKMPSSLFIFPIKLIYYIFLILRTYLLLKKKTPDILISTGGYMSFPFCVSAKLLNIKLFLFEPNIVLGRSNKYILKYADKLICCFKKIKDLPEKFYEKKFLIDPILDKKIYKYYRFKKKKFDKRLKIIILGGSQGAKFFDTFAEKVIINLSKKKKLFVYQQVFKKQKIIELKKKYKDKNIQYKLFNFDKNVLSKVAKCDLAITRCGASTLAELTYLNIPFMGIPFPYAADNHQFYNAKYYESKGCCWLYDQKKINIYKVLNILKNLHLKDSIYNKKKKNIHKIFYQNSWNSINKKIINLINEN